MTDENTGIDYDYIRDTILQFAKDQGLKAGELGKLLGSKGKTGGGQSNRGTYFFGKSPERITIEEVNCAANAMGLSIHDLIRTVQPQIENSGAHAQNYTQTGERAVIRNEASTNGLPEEVMAFLSLPSEERRKLIEQSKAA